MDSWLSANPFETVFFSDLFDVVVNRDPFELFETPTLFISHQGKRLEKLDTFLRTSAASMAASLRGFWANQN